MDLEAITTLSKETLQKAINPLVGFRIESAETTRGNATIVKVSYVLETFMGEPEFERVYKVLTFTYQDILIRFEDPTESNSEPQD